jgi:predicted transposase/invertase (TIGR01784 family)
MDKPFISPLNDYVVKCIYGDQKNIENTRGLLKTVLDIPLEEYDRLTVIDPFLKRWWDKDKLGIVDIRLSTAGGRQAAIEFQIQPYRAMPERIVYYNSKMIVGQMKSGFKYETLNQTISVVISDYTMLPHEHTYLNYIELRNRTSGALFTELQQYIILELSKLPDEDDGQAVWPYMRFFKCRRKEEFEMLAKGYPEVQGLVKEYQRISWSDRRRMIAEYREKQWRDEQAALDYARDEGRAESLQALEEKDRELSERDRELSEKDREIAELRRRLRDKEGS